MNSNHSKPFFPWLLLFGRTACFLIIQVLFAVGYLLAGSTKAWDASAAWWPYVVTITNVIFVVALILLFRLEGKNYWEIFRIRAKTILGDLLALVAFMLVAGPAGYFPNIMLAGWLFGNSQTVLDLFIRPLPLWAVYGAIVLFPLTQGLAELATYFGYVMPRLEKNGLQPWLAVSLSVLMLGLQHIAVPLVFDIRFITWRALMFIPFAFVIGLLLRWRPRLLPYMAAVHALMNISVATMFLPVAY